MLTAPTSVSAPAVRWSWPARAACIALVLLGLGLRAFHLDRTPAHNETADEYAWTWAGMTLLTEGKPRAWSWLDAYGTGTTVTWKGNPYKLVTPWMDHPPLFSVLMGAWMLLHGTTNILDVNLEVMRQVPLLLSVCTMLLLAWVVARTAGAGAALITLSLYAVAPPIVLQNRLVVSESLFVPLALLGLVALMKLNESPAWRGWWVVLVVCCAALPLTKLVACCLGFFLLLWAVMRGQRWQALAVCAGTVLGLGLYAAYGFGVGGAMFTKVLESHSDRFHGFSGFFELVFIPKTVHAIKPWLPLMVGTLTAFWTAVYQPHHGWAWAVPVYAFLMTFFVNQQEVYGWYRIPLYPFACAALAERVWAAWKSGRPHGAWMWFGVAWVTAFAVLWDRWSAASQHIKSVRYGFLAGMLLVPLVLLWPRAAPRVWTRCVLLVALLVNMVAGSTDVLMW